MAVLQSIIKSGQNAGFGWRRELQSTSMSEKDYRGCPDCQVARLPGCSDCRGSLVLVPPDCRGSQEGPKEEQSAKRNMSKCQRLFFMSTTPSFLKLSAIVALSWILHSLRKTTAETILIEAFCKPLDLWKPIPNLNCYCACHCKILGTKKYLTWKMVNKYTEININININIWQKVFIWAKQEESVAGVD